MLSISTLFIPELLMVPRTERERERERWRERERSLVLENALT